MEEKKLYETIVTNRAGIKGVVEINNGEDFIVSGPRDSAAGTNPEQLIGASLATCLNATLEALEARRHIDHKSSVEVTITLHHDTEGYQFFLDALVTIPHVDQTVAAEMLAEAERRCPVAKLLQGSANVRVHL
ncbi:OsmC family protein [Enterococcus timonensis]|uniref:OsmC family protein n=1 Tax=Enterococcus timonensis TaxID=1852364 RepID=UPI0008DA276B|nr:OsmC family protein [Enterococcus timonensis]